MKQMILALLIPAITLGQGCNRSDETEGGQTSLARKGDGIEFTVKGGGTEAHFAANQSGVPLPDGFPQDATIFPGATLVTSATSSAGFTLALQTQSVLNKVIAFYEKDLKQNGWKIVVNSRLGADGGMLSAEKDQRSQYLTITQRDGTTTINITVN